MAVVRAKSAKAVGRYQLVYELGQSYLGPLWAVRSEVADGSGQLGMLRLVSLAGLSAETRVGLLEAAWQAMEVRDDRICSVTDVVASDGELGVIADYVEGLPLRTLQGLASIRRMPLPVPVAVRIVSDLVLATVALHQATIDLGEESVPLYGGLSTDSLLVGSDGASRVLDAAVASAASGIESLGGNPDRVAYAAPEQLGEKPKSDARTDVFSAGILAWELLSNRRLFLGSDKGVVQKVLAGKIPRLDEVKRRGEPDLPAALVALVARSLERDPERRFPTMKALADALSSCGVAPAADAEVAAFVSAAADSALARVQEALADAKGGPRGLKIKSGARAAPAPATPSAVQQPAPVVISKPAAPVATAVQPRPAVIAKVGVTASPKPGAVMPRTPTVTGLAAVQPAAAPPAPAQREPAQPAPAHPTPAQPAPAPAQPAKQAGPPAVRPIRAPSAAFSATTSRALEATPRAPDPRLPLRTPAVAAKLSLKQPSQGSGDALPPRKRQPTMIGIAPPAFGAPAPAPEPAKPAPPPLAPLTSAPPPLGVLEDLASAPLPLPSPDEAALLTHGLGNAPKPDPEEVARAVAAATGADLDTSDEDPTATYDARALLKHVEAMGNKKSDASTAPLLETSPPVVPAPVSAPPDDALSDVSDSPTLAPPAAELMSGLMIEKAVAQGEWLDGPDPSEAALTHRQAPSNEALDASADDEIPAFPRPAALPKQTPPPTGKAAMPSYVPERRQSLRTGPPKAGPATSPPPAYLPSQVPPPLIHDPRANRATARPQMDERRAARRRSGGLVVGAFVSLGLVIVSAAIAISVIRSRAEAEAPAAAPPVAAVAPPAPAPNEPAEAPPAPSAAAEPAAQGSAAPPAEEPAAAAEEPAAAPEPETAAKPAPSAPVPQAAKQPFAIKKPQAGVRAPAPKKPAPKKKKDRFIPNDI